MSELQWTIDAYTLVLACLLVLSGSTADRFGRRRTFQVGLTMFTASSLLCSLAPGLGWLIAFRSLQAVGGSMLNPVAMSIITNVFTERKERARAIGIWGGVIGISFALGPIVGGIMIESVGWRGIFWINVPIGIAAIILSALFIPESRAPKARRPDPVGQALVIVTLASLTYGIIEAPHRGWGSPTTIALLATFVIALVALVRYEQRAPRAVDRAAAVPKHSLLRGHDRGRMRVRRVRGPALPRLALPAGRARLLGPGCRRCASCRSRSAPWSARRSRAGWWPRTELGFRCFSAVYR